jgi:8-oxo-dGTP pyrophosphatase MutT (NUDIX family)
MSDQPRTPAVPRSAATILVVRDDPFEVLMVRRHAEAVFASALVFPGGVVDPDDASEDWLPYVSGADGLSEAERARRIAACRETFEEATLFLAAGDAPPPSATAAPARFLDLVKQAGARLALDALHPFGHWITPEMAPKRFDTHFYLCRAPAGQIAVCDGGETVSLEWVSPAAALASAEAGERTILFPTQMNLRRLAESVDSAQAIAAAQARPPFTVTPRAERTAEGVRVVIPHEAGYGVTTSSTTPVARG